MGASAIDYVTKSWNPVDGCYAISPACDNCWADAMARRFWGARQFHQVEWHEDRLQEPLTWKKPQTVFVVSMGDLFHHKVAPAQVAAVFDVMAATPQHRYLVLTKRSDRMRWIVNSFIAGAALEGGCGPMARTYNALEKAILDSRWPLPNVWGGVTAENQYHLEQRAADLLRTNFAHHWISFEPLLERVNAVPILTAEVDGRRIGWAVIGCESGHPKARRPMLVDWARDLIQQCKQAEVPVYLKQMEVDGHVIHRPSIDFERHLHTPWEGEG